MDNIIIIDSNNNLYMLNNNFSIIKFKFKQFDVIYRRNFEMQRQILEKSIRKSNEKIKVFFRLFTSTYYI